MDKNLLKKVVIKIGSSSLSSIDKGLNHKNIRNLVKEIAWLLASNIKVILVTSGAISMGLYICDKTRRPTKLSELQYLASIGQIELMQAYKKQFNKVLPGYHLGQILLTNEDLVSRERYLNAKNALNELLRNSAIPVVNENDTVAYDEIQFGDNDVLASTVANLIEADLLVLFTDQDGLYDKDPTKFSNAKLIECINADDEQLKQLAISSKSSSGIGSGGIKSKILAAQTASRSGASTIIAKGVDKNFFQKLFDNQISCTTIVAQKKNITARQKWMIDNTKPKGILYLDSGAVNALKIKKKSLLPVGVIKLTGNFFRGDLLSCLDQDGVEVARGLSNFSSEDAKKIIGKKAKTFSDDLENRIDENLIHRDNLVII